MDFANQQISNLKLSRIFAWLLAITFISLTMGYLGLIQGKIRDIKRRADFRQLQTALAVYQDKFGSLPKTTDGDVDGWDNSLEPSVKHAKDFLNILKDKKIIDQDISDPLNFDNYYYRYKKFPAGAYGCDKTFAILQINNFEVYTKDHGFGSCPQRNFADELPNGYTMQIFE